MRWPHGDPDVLARAVLAEPAFRHAAVSNSGAPQRAFYEIVWAWFVVHVLQPLFGPLVRALAATRGAGAGLGSALVVVALLVVGFVVVRIVLAFLRPPSRRAEAAADAAEPLAADSSAADLRRLAHEAARRGDYARAIAALWAAALAALDECGLVTFDRSRTPGEYRRLLDRGEPSASEPFGRLCERYVEAAYSGVAPSAVDFAAAERALADFEPAL